MQAGEIVVLAAGELVPGRKIAAGVAERIVGRGSRLPPTEPSRNQAHNNIRQPCNHCPLQKDKHLG